MKNAAIERSRQKWHLLTTRRFFLSATTKEWGVPLLLALSLIVSCCLLSPRKPFWNDEILSYYVVAEPSFNKMLSVFADRLNNSPILYFFMGWVWVQGFGASELSLRLFSSAGFCVAAFFTWFLVRRSYTFAASSFATVGAFALSVLVLEQNAEARMYGLYLALVAIAMWQHDVLSHQNTCEPRMALGVAVVNAALLHTHLFGIFYSAAIIASYVLRDMHLGRRRLNLYGGFLCSWLTLVAYIPAFLIQAEAGEPRGWIPPPNLRDLVKFYIMDLRFSSSVLIGAGLLWLWARYRGNKTKVGLGRTGGSSAFAALWTQYPTMALAFSFLLLPLGIWLASLLVKPVFYDRYMIPTILGVAVAIAHFLHHLGNAKQPALRWYDWPFRLATDLFLYLSSKVAAGAVALGVALAAPIVFAVGSQQKPTPGYNDQVLGHADLPVNVQYSHEMLPRMYYASARTPRYVYLLDWETAVLPESGSFATQEYKIMESLLHQFPERFAGHVVDADAFLAAHDRFLVLDQADYDGPCRTSRPWYSLAGLEGYVLCPQLLERKLLADTHYSITRVDNGYHGSMVVLLVERIADRNR